MFLHDFAYVDAPADVVCARILEAHGAWLGPLATDAVGEGEALRIRIGPAGPSAGRSEAAVVELGPPRRRADNALVLPLTWRVSGVGATFPVLSADLEIAALGAARTQLTLMGRYDPPVGVLGRRLDQLLFQRIAEATIRSFLRRVAEALERPPGDATTTGEAAIGA
jgi:hypothetical protein